MKRLLLCAVVGWSGLVSIPARSQIVELASWQGAQTGEQFGVAVAIGGDFNLDGRADLAIGASGNDEAGENAGKVSVYLGRTSPLGTPDLVLYGEAGSFFGSAVDWVGDVNGDGTDDLLVGAFRDGQAGVNAGKAFLYCGGLVPDATPELILVGPAPGAYFGRAVAGAGDLNGDGFADFAVGAPRTTRGTVYLYHGSLALDGIADLVIQGLADGDRLGSAIAGVGNADGIPGDDLLVGATRVSTGATWRGAAYLYSGGPSMDAASDWTFLGEEAGDQLGASVAAAGDVNADGIPDLLIGAPYHNPGGRIDAGRAYLFRGGTLGQTPFFRIDGQNPDDNLGFAVAGCGDVTGNGFGHFVAGSPGSDAGGVDAGRVVLSPGGNPPTTGALQVIQGSGTDAQFGYAVAGVGTGNRSFCAGARPDFAVGAWGFAGTGRASVHGTAGPSGIEDHAGPDPVARLLVTPNPGGAFRFVWAKGEAPARSNGRATLRIHAVDGRLVWESAVAGAAAGEPLAFRWDGDRLEGGRAPAGSYTFVLEEEGSRRAAGRIILIR